MTLDLTKPVKYKNKPYKIVHVYDSGLNEKYPIHSICICPVAAGGAIIDISKVVTHTRYGLFRAADAAAFNEWDLVNVEEDSEEIAWLKELKEKYSVESGSSCHIKELENRKSMAERIIKLLKEK